MKKALLMVLMLSLVLVFTGCTVDDEDAVVVAVKGVELVNHSGPEGYSTPTLKDDERGGYSGYFVGWDTAGTRIEWEIDVPVAGEYVFVVRYATHDSSYAHRSLEIGLVDSEPYVSVDLIEFEPGGDYGREQWLVKILDEPMTLEAGLHLIALESLPTDQQYTGMNVVNLGFISADQLPLTNNKAIELVDAVLY